MKDSDENATQHIVAALIITSTAAFLWKVDVLPLGFAVFIDVICIAVVLNYWNHL